MGVTNYITASNASSEALKTANLLKLLSVNALISGERGTGKLTLAEYIMPNAVVINASDFDQLLDAMQSSETVIIRHLENIPNIQTLKQHIEQSSVRIVATSSDSYKHELLDEIFSVKVHLPPLSERPEDIIPLQQSYTEEAKKVFGGDTDISFSEIAPDLSGNAHSIRRQVFAKYLFQSITEEELMDITEDFLSERLGSNNDYRNFLHLYEVPLIRAGLKRFKSQLQLADKLGLNRNTLRKKIAENKEYNLDL